MARGVGSEGRGSLEPFHVGGGLSDWLADIRTLLPANAGLGAVLWFERAIPTVMQLIT